ncbi:MAG: hypothetical protein IJT43_09425 [Stomatobaculum sp.]|nr:hypothetical protein [Stomatobaculum sp.]
MKFTVEHETSSSMRIRLKGDKPSKRTGEAIHAILSRTAGIKNVRIYPATKGIFVRHSLDRETLIGILKELDPETIQEVKQELKEERHELIERLQRIQDPQVLEEALQNHRVDVKELQTRKLDPELKRRMRIRIFVEAGADLLLPAPVQVVYHAWQLVTLKSL